MIGLTGKRYLSLLPHNRVVRAALGAKRGRLLEGMKHIVFEAGEQFWSPERPLPYALFPLRGVVSMQLAASSGGQVEVGMVGHEGFAGVPLFLGAEEGRMTAVALTAGEALAAPPEVFRDGLKTAAFRTAVERYIHFFVAMLGEISLCNRVHVIEKLIIRRLLLMQDLTNTDSVHLTQDVCSRLLGVRRASISQAAGRLQKQGAIEYDHRGRLTILDRSRLEELACPCYHAIKADFDRLLRV
jgi:CRP-like cAMP-binding protein